MNVAAAPDQLKLALERIFQAHERTLMAWLRTATSMIIFRLRPLRVLLLCPPREISNPR